MGAIQRFFANVVFLQYAILPTYANSLAQIGGVAARLSLSGGKANGSSAVEGTLREALMKNRGAILYARNAVDGSSENVVIGFESGEEIEVDILSKADAEHIYFEISKYCDKFYYVLPHLDFISQNKYAIEIVLKDEVASCGDIPPSAPEIWPGKWRCKESLPDFFKRVWGPYIKNGLTLADIRKRDLRLCRAIERYGRGVGEGEWPSNLKIPSQRDILSKSLDKFKKEGADALRPNELISVARKLQRMQVG